MVCGSLSAKGVGFVSSVKKVPNKDGGKSGEKKPTDESVGFNRVFYLSMVRARVA